MSDDDSHDISEARRKAAAEQNAADLVHRLTHFANGWNRLESSAFIETLANEHPTLLAQVAKATATAVMRRATFDPGWRGGMPTDHYRRCAEYGEAVYPAHPAHDGRLTCDTVIGAELMARQPMI